MRRILAIALAGLVLMLAIAPYAPSVQADVPPAYVTKLDYPKTVKTGSLFTVTIQVSYSNKFGMVDVGIWDVEKGSVIQSLVSNVTLDGPGQASFTFHLSAPLYAGRWDLEGVTRAWIQDAWFTDKAGFSPFSVLVLENASLTLSGLKPTTNVLIDGKKFIPSESTLIEQLRFGVHSLEVPDLIQDGLGSRFLFVNWSDGVTSNPRTVLLVGNLTISPIYVKQYLLTVNSNFGTTAGSGWYEEGKIAQFLVSDTYQSPSFFGLVTDYYRFISWSGDSQISSPVGTIVMNGPKTIGSNWARINTQLNLVGVTDLLIFASCLLAFRTILALRKKLTRKGPDVVRLLAFLFLMVLIIGAGLRPASVYGQLPTPTNGTVVSIGDAFWYYWNQPASDTCIFWLGGGTVFSQGGYLINPLEYESFGTIRFLQELTRFYSVVALEKGSYKSSDAANRTLYQELIQGQFVIDRQVHRWINAQGYKHTIMLGYSVGAIVAASIAISNPDEWTNSDGLILITALLPPNAISGAHSLNANLMLVYGHAPTFELTGTKFFENAPSEGWHGASYFHKEFHVLDEMGHEVWSPLKTNRYSPTALRIMVNFVEKSKAFQLGDLSKITTESIHGNWTFDILSVALPSTVYWDEAYFVNVAVASHGHSTGATVIVAYDPESRQTLSVTDCSRLAGVANLRLNMPSVNSSQVSFSLLVLHQQDDYEWQLASKSYPVKASATDQVTLRIVTLIPNSRVLIDGRSYTVSSRGILQERTSKGVHTIEVDPTIDQNATRFLFTRWSDSDQSPFKSIQIDNDTSLEAIYRTQYYVSVVSPFGVTHGTGWYDANSTIEPSISPIAIGQPSLVFNNWTNGYGVFGLGAPIKVRSPMVIRADWAQDHRSQIDGGSLVWVAFSIILFSLLLILDLRRSWDSRQQKTVKLGRW